MSKTCFKSFHPIPASLELLLIPVKALSHKHISSAPNSIFWVKEASKFILSSKILPLMLDSYWPALANKSLPIPPVSLEGSKSLLKKSLSVTSFNVLLTKMILPLPRKWTISIKSIPLKNNKCKESSKHSASKPKARSDQLEKSAKMLIWVTYIRQVRRRNWV